MNWLPEPEELRMSLVDKVYRQVRKRGVRPSPELLEFVVIVAVMVAMIVYVVLYVNDDKKKLTSYKPEIKLNSLIFCSTDTSSDSDNVMFWNLRFNITNPNNYSVVSTWFAVSIFSFNQTKLLTQTTEVGISVRAMNHTSGFAYAEASNSLDALDQTKKGTIIRFDLKFNAVFHFRYGFAKDFYHTGDLVCGDAKVALNMPSSNKASSFCGSLVGDHLACSYQTYYKKSYWQYYHHHD